MTKIKEYFVGASVSMIDQLPELSPRQQDTVEALLHLDTIEITSGGRSGPTIRLRMLIERLGSMAGCMKAESN